MTVVMIGLCHRSQSRSEYTLPHVVLSGPNYSSDYSSFVSRVEANGQLGALPPDNYTTSSVDAFEDAWLSELQRTPDMASEGSTTPTTHGCGSNLQSIQDLDSTLTCWKRLREIN